MMPPISSTTARVVRNILSDMGTRLPSIASTPSEKAISVAMGMAAPLLKSVPALNIRYIPTGTTMPPIAAMIGRSACLNELNSPTSTSRFISSPIVKKNIAMRASFMN